MTLYTYQPLTQAELKRVGWTRSAYGTYWTCGPRLQNRGLWLITHDPTGLRFAELPCTFDFGAACNARLVSRDYTRTPLMYHAALHPTHGWVPTHQRDPTGAVLVPGVERPVPLEAFTTPVPQIVIPQPAGGSPAMPRPPLPAIQAMLDAPDTPALLGLMRFGFELETQRSNGWRSSDRVSPTDPAEQRVAALAQLRGSMPFQPRDVADFDALVGQLADAVLAGPRAANFIRARPAFEVLSERLRSPQLEVDTDGSVAGFEIRTTGGLTISEFDTELARAFGVEHEIDNGCSFHVHVSVPGVQHRYGERFYRALVEWLVDHLDEVPATVRQRWAGNRRYFRLVIEQDKFTWVHAHSLGTWEFRCFGRVTNAADGRRCAELAARAMQHAYRVVSGQVVMPNAELDAARWQSRMVRRLNRGLRTFGLSISNQSAA